MEANRRACRREEELAEPVNGEPGVLDGGGGVAPQVAATDQVWPDGGIDPLVVEGIEAIMFRTIDDGLSLWVASLPPEVLRLPDDLVRVDTLLDDAAVCRIPLDGEVPHPATLMKLTTRCAARTRWRAE